MAGRRVGLVYDERMCAHANPHDDAHPEKPDRIVAIARCLQHAGVFDRCIHVGAREATDTELSTVHTKKHIELMRRISSKAYGSGRREKLARNYNSIYFNKGSSESALLAAGSVVELCIAVAKGDLEAGAAIVRPPGHHAEAGFPMGFCLFNNVAIAAHVLVHEKQDLGIRKILIVDWDVHHGNGIQNMFWDDDQVLYFSVHRYDDGGFYPTGNEGNYDRIGSGRAAGFNVNVPWPHGGFGDADYLAVWDHVLLPIAKEFSPGIVLISGGFDSAQGDPLGGCCLTPSGYAEMTRKLMDIAEGRVVLVLEGGYNLQSIAESYLSCVQTLIGELPNGDSLPPKKQPLKSTWNLMIKVREVLQDFWPALNKLSGSFQKAMEESISPLDEALLSLTLRDENSDDESLDLISETKKVENQVIDSSADSFGNVQQWIKSEQADHCDISTKLTTDTENRSERSESQIKGKEMDHPCSGSLTSESLEGPALCLKENSVLPDLVSGNRGVEIDSNEGKKKLTYVWYASYGSNLWKDRFMCYLQGGQVESMKAACLGTRNKSPPIESTWMQVGNQMFFGHSYTKTWGPGGTAFLEAYPTDRVSTHVRLYKITLDQFNDLFLQENCILDFNNELITPNFVESLNRSSKVATHVKDSWYGTLLYLGDKDDTPILSFTCSEEDMEKFRAGSLPLCPPSESYQGAITRGLTEDLGLSEEKALSYISSKIKT